MNEKRYICYTEVAGDKQSRDIGHKSLYATSEQKAREHYDNWAKDNLPPWAKDFKVIAVHINSAPQFLIEVRKVKKLRWWEEEAITYAQLGAEEPDEFDVDLYGLAQSIEDVWSEVISRDGEPGPQPGNVDFEVDDDETKLTIRSKRILAVITIKPEGGES